MNPFKFRRHICNDVLFYWISLFVCFKPRELPARFCFDGLDACSSDRPPYMLLMLTPWRLNTLLMACCFGLFVGLSSVRICKFWSITVEASATSNWLSIVSDLWALCFIFILCLLLPSPVLGLALRRCSGGTIFSNSLTWFSKLLCKFSME